jgi:hypothetical protein
MSATVSCATRVLDQVNGSKGAAMEMVEQKVATMISTLARGIYLSPTKLQHLAVLAFRK